MGKLNYAMVMQIIAVIVRFSGGFILLSSFVSWFYEEKVFVDILLTGLLLIGLSFIGKFFPKTQDKELSKRDGYLVVALGWIFLTISGALPYWFSGAIPNFTDAAFESISGFTTTGSSILTDIESMPKGLLFWRSMTHWLGGMGIIVLAVAILPLLGVGGMQLFVAEAPGPSADKLRPRIADTAKRLWILYVALTGIQSILLRIAGMNWFDSVNHALCTLSTGGFSTKNASLAHWNDNPWIQYIVIIFMFIAGANFVLTYFALNGKVKKLTGNEEFRYYFGIVALFTIVSTLFIYFQADVSQSSIAHPMVWGALESAFRHALFQVLAVITTTGFVTADFTMWTPILTVLFFGMMFLGGSAGSTSGGVKFVRHIIMIKNGFMEFKRQLHPKAIIPVRFNGKAVHMKIVYNILAFFVIYMSFFIIGALALALTGLDFLTAIGGSATALGNVGPGLGDVSPVDNFAHLPAAAKWITSFLMIIGRLELFTFLIILTPYFWSERF
ncbi:MAG: TrkH family potassium uptake protein [Flavobacteriales bacterium]|jgi:trk system potassium uptake protein TrkH|nr:TrkH family potassium uptake protein [Flavobacteriales bacterium]